MGFYCPPFFYALDCPNRRFKFEKRSQLFIRTHNESLSVTMRVSNPDRSASLAHADRVKIVLDCRTVNDQPPMSSTIPAHVLWNSDRAKRWR
jgi:hypothetical protein